MAGFSIFSVTFSGTNSGSPTTLTVPGLKVGDRRIHLAHDSEPNEDRANAGGNFGYVVTTDDELWQTAGNFSVGTYTAVFIRFT